MIYWTLFYEFFLTGLFAVGGGLGTLPFLNAMARKYPWLTPGMVAEMLAISESTPGPLGINMASYAGFMAAGPLGTAVAVFGEVLPSVIVIVLIARAINRFKNNPLVDSVFSRLRPAAAGLIAAAGFSVLKGALFDPAALHGGAGILAALAPMKLLLFAVLLFAAFLPRLKKLHPLVYIAVGAAAGVALGL